MSVVALLAGFAVPMREPYGLQPVAAQRAQFERDSRPVAINAPYHGQWTLAGRLRAPLAAVPGERIADWPAEHPRGHAVFLHRDERDIPAGTTIDSHRRRRGGWLAILRTSAAD